MTSCGSMKHGHSLSVSRYQTCVAFDTDTTPTHNYIELCDFLKLLVVSLCQCPCCVRCSCPYPCFIGGPIKWKKKMQWFIEDHVACLTP